jgi:hypothetical protein
MAVIARAGSKLVKDVRDKKEATKSRARFWEMAGSKMGKITGVALWGCLGSWGVGCSVWGWGGEEQRGLGHSHRCSRVDPGAVLLPMASGMRCRVGW